MEFSISFPSFLIAMAAAVAFLVLGCKSRSKNREQQRLPPSPAGRLPIIGHLHLLSDMPHHTFAGMAQKVGPIMYLQLGRVPTVVISSAALAREVLKTHDQLMCNRPQLLSAQYLSLGCSDVTFSKYGAYWRQARKICVTELLSSKRVGSFRAVRAEETTRLLGDLRARSGSPVDLSSLLFNLANDVLCRVAFGRRFADDARTGSSKGLVEVLTETQALFAGFCIGDFFPEWGWVNSLSGYRARLENNLADLRAVSHKIIQDHQLQLHTNRSKGDLDEDFVDVLLRVQQSKDLEVPITDDNLKALVLDMFVAGTDTSSSTLEWTMTELVRHPEAMKKVQDEVRGVAHGKQTVDETHLPHLGYMKAAIKEAMRVHPAVPLLVPRESMERCLLNGYEIPAKTRVLINTYAIGRDPESWGEPLRYDPERFLEGADDEIDYKGTDFRFLPFGGGRRGCPGYSFGMATVEIALARLLFHFDWELPPGVQPHQMDLSEIFGLATRKKSPLVLVPTINKDYP